MVCFTIFMTAATTLSLSSTYKTSIRKGQKEPPTLLKKRLWHRCFPVNFAKFLRTPLLQSTSGRLPLKGLLTIKIKKKKNIDQIWAISVFVFLEKCPYSEFLYSAFSRIRIQCGPEKHRIRTPSTQFY